MFALLVSTCCEKSGTNCYHLVTRLMTLLDLLQVVPGRLIQAIRNKLLQLSLLSLTCYETTSDLLKQHDLLGVYRPHQPCNKMITCSRFDNNWNKATVRTHPVVRCTVM